MLILSSCGFESSELLPFCLDRLEEPPENVKITVVLTAAISFYEEVVVNDFCKYITALFNKSGIQEISFFDFAKDNPNYLFDSNIVLIMGGNPYYLLQQVKKSDSEEIIRKIALSNRIVIGVSAGAMMLSNGLVYFKDFLRINNDGFDDFGLEDLIGLQLADHYIWPHFDVHLSEKPDLDDELTKLEQELKIKVTRLNDSENIVVENGKEAFVKFN